MPLVSIVIATYNDAPTLSACLRTALTQSLEDIEVICVDDASDDQTPSILADFAARDRRLRVMKLEQRSSAATARVAGAQIATAPYILFVDSDDELTENACEIARERILAEGADVLQFTVEIINDSGEPGWLLGREACYDSTRAMLDACYTQGFPASNVLWNRIFETELVRRAFAWARPAFVSAANDLYLFFLIATHARLYCAVSTPPLYRHFVGRSAGDRQGSPVALVHHVCGKARALALIEAYIAERQLPVDPQVVKKLRDRFERSNASAYRLLPPNIQAQCFEILLSYWDVDAARRIATLAQTMGKENTRREQNA